MNNVKLAVILFHKNIDRYPKEWVSKCIYSIKNQTYKKFDVFEIDYGGAGNQIYKGSIFESILMDNHVFAHNYLLDKVFLIGYTYAANVNVDDFYSVRRFEKQLPYMEQKYDVISSNFYNVTYKGVIKNRMKMDDKDMIFESKKGHNILCHPVIIYSKHFWTTCSRLKPEEIPFDDFNLWKRSYGKYKFVIVPYFLAYYRIHPFKVCNQ